MSSAFSAALVELPTLNARQAPAGGHFGKQMNRISTRSISDPVLLGGTWVVYGREWLDCVVIADEDDEL
jgi:hypothetical protein